MSLDDAKEKLQSRISAYSKAHDILLQREWLSATLENVVEAARAAIGWGASDRIRSLGPQVTLGPQAALTFSLVFHELLTNACKYGALSVDDGRIFIEWRLDNRQDGEHLLTSWREVGGPIVSAPTRNGFGSRLIGSSLRAYGEVSVAYEPTGLVVETDLPLSKLQFRSELAEIDV